MGAVALPVVVVVVLVTVAVVVVVAISSSSSPSRRSRAHRSLTAAIGGAGSGNPPADARHRKPTRTDPTAPPKTAHRSRAAATIAAVRRLAAHGLPLYCGGSERRMVALTFDDGPGVYTHYAIAKLEAAHLRATFFLVGKEVTAWPGLARRERAVAAFGDHTMTHPYLPALPRREAAWQIVADRRLIERTVHEPVLLFRPPYEAHTRAIDAEVRRLRMVEVLWDVDSADSLGGNYLAIEHRVIAGLRPGSIVLMHENHGQTIRALAAIFTALHRRHLRAVTVPQLIAHDPPSLSQLRRGWEGCPVRAHGGNGG
jgi:peptidoglycan/xylan/chitin deacetylase (PgdA/CDA1 family)